MNNIFTQLETMKHVTNNERTVCQFILNHSDQIIEMSAKELAEACYVSTATIYRLCNKLNIEGYNELKVRISQSMNDYLEQKQPIDFDFPIKKNQTNYQIATSLKENYEQTLASTFNLFDMECFRRIALKIRKAKHVMIYTSANNIPFAQSFKMLMREIGVIVEVPVDEYEQRLIASTGDAQDLAFIISYEGRLVNIDKICELLKKQKTPTVLISSCDYKLKKMTPEEHIYMSSYEHKYNKVASYSTRLSLLYILDMLYSCYFELDYSKNLKTKIDIALETNYESGM